MLALMFYFIATLAIIKFERQQNSGLKAFYRFLTHLYTGKYSAVITAVGSKIFFCYVSFNQRLPLKYSTFIKDIFSIH